MTHHRPTYGNIIQGLNSWNQKVDMSFAIRYARNDGCGPIRIKNTSLTSLITLPIISVFRESVQNPDPYIGPGPDHNGPFSNKS